MINSMEDNPYMTIINVIKNSGKSQIPSFYRFGNVLSVSPFKINVSGNEMNSSDLLINSTLDLNDIHINDVLFLIPIEDEQRYFIVGKVFNI